MDKSKELNILAIMSFLLLLGSLFGFFFLQDVYSLLAIFFFLLSLLSGTTVIINKEQVKWRILAKISVIIAIVVSFLFFFFALSTRF